MKRILFILLLFGTVDLADAGLTKFPGGGGSGGSGVADNLGDHTMTQQLDAGNFAIYKASSVLVGTQTSITALGMSVYGTTVPIILRRDNTEGPFFVFDGGGNNYGFINLVSGGFVLSTGTQSDTIGVFSKYYGIGTYPPKAKFHVTHDAGVNGGVGLVRFTTGTGANLTDLFAVWPSSINAGVTLNLAGFDNTCTALETDADGNIICGTDASGGGGGSASIESLVKGVVASSPVATNNFDAIAFTASVNGSTFTLHLKPNSTYFIQTGTGSTNGVFNISSATIGQLNAFLVQATAYHTLSQEAANWSSPLGELQFDADGLGVLDFRINSTSSTLPRDTIMYSTDVYIGSLYQGFVSSNVFSTPTLIGYGNPYWNQGDSTYTGVTYAFFIDTRSTSSDPWIELVGVSTGIYPDNMIFGVAIGTAARGGTDRTQVVWKSTFMVVCSSDIAGVGGSVKESGKKAFLGAGAQAANTDVIFIHIWAINQGGSGQRFLFPPKLYWRKLSA